MLVDLVKFIVVNQKIRHRSLNLAVTLHRHEEEVGIKDKDNAITKSAVLANEWISLEKAFYQHRVNPNKHTTENEFNSHNAQKKQR